MFDLAISILALLVCLPICFFIAIAIKIDSPGSVFFKQNRLTHHGRVFTMYKFRTMIENAEHMGTGLFNYKNDFRVTKVGAFLRKSSLDELPQVLNVLTGDMSLVGPRPPVTYELGNYDELSSLYKKRFDVLAGITGLAQVSGRNELSWDEKIRYDNQYIDLFQKYGILIDLKIIFLTVVNIFRMKDIYETPEQSTEGLSAREIAIKASNDVINKAKCKI